MLRILSLLLLCLAIVSSPVPRAQADTLRLKCSEALVTFEFEQPEKLACLCDTAQKAIEFLGSIGLDSPEHIRVQIVDEIPSNLDHTLVGSFNVETREVKLLTFARTKGMSQWDQTAFGVEMTEELWCSYAAHEIAHVISSIHLDPEIKRHTAGEYISAVTQLEVLDDRVRQQILTNNKDMEPYQARSEMSEIYFLFAPQQFALKSYLHFKALDDPGAFIDQLVRYGTAH